MPRNRNPSPTHFWAYDDVPDGAPAVLRLEGPIDTETWWGDEVTPGMFREELEAHPGDIEVYINSPGGDVIAATQIYTMLVEHRGTVTVKIEGIAASAASIVAMAGTTVLMAPTAYMMIHDAMSIAIGNKRDMEHEAAVLDEIDAGIRDAYRLKTGLRDSKLAQMMEDETWMSARTCIDLGFADGYIGAAKPDEEEPDEPDEDEPDEDDPDNIEQIDDRIAAALRGHALPAVAFSGRRQLAGLRKLLRDEETLASVNREALAALRREDARRECDHDLDGAMGAILSSGIRLGVIAGNDARIDELRLVEPDDEAPESDPEDALRRKRLQLLSL